MKSIKRVLAIFILANIVACSLVGCMQNKGIVEVNNEQITEQVYRIFLWKAQQGIESLQPDIWEIDNVGGKSPEDIAKESALNSICYHVAAQQKAEELKIKLTKEERKEVKALAKQAVADNKILSETYGVKQKDYIKFYTYMAVSEKVLEALNQSYEPNQEEIKNTIDELKASGALPSEATIVEIYLSTVDEQGNAMPEDKKQQVYEKAQEILDKALKGEDMKNLATLYSEDGSVSENEGEYTFTQGELDENLENVVFNEATPGEVYNKVVETKTGCVILKVVSVNHLDEQAIRNEAISQISANFAKQELKEMSKMVTVTTKEGYENVHLMLEKNQEQK